LVAEKLVDGLNFQVREGTQDQREFGANKNMGKMAKIGWKALEWKTLEWDFHRNRLSPSNHNSWINFHHLHLFHYTLIPLIYWNTKEGDFFLVTL